MDQNREPAALSSLSLLSPEEKWQIISSDPEDPSTWSMWDAALFIIIGESYKDSYVRFREWLKGEHLREWKRTTSDKVRLEPST